MRPVCCSCSAPALFYGIQAGTEFVTTAGDGALETGRGYFTTPADLLLADATVAGDSVKAASLAPARKRERGRPGPHDLHALGHRKWTRQAGVVAALLEAGIDPEQDQQYVSGAIDAGLATTSGAMITARNERLLRAVLDAGVELKPP